MLTPAGLTNILENYAQIVEEKDPRTGKKKRKQVWPRYHQLGVVRQALADVRTHGAGKRYLIQHSAGSGNSNSIAWLAHQLIGLKRDKEVFDSVIVMTDRRLLDDQIQTTIKQFMQVGATVGHAERAGDLRKFIEEGKKIIVSTVQKFPFIFDEIATGLFGDSSGEYRGIRTRWRRGGDSNPRDPFEPTRVPGVRLKPGSATSPRATAIMHQGVMRGHLLKHRSAVVNKTAHRAPRRPHDRSAYCSR